MAITSSAKSVTLEDIVNRINQIDAKIKAAEPWLHRKAFENDLRERELLVAKANAKFGAELKHEWR